MSRIIQDSIPLGFDQTDSLIPCKPFLKWVGGKRGLLDELKPRIPKYNRYFEPFVGGGALFFALQPDSAFLSDLNMRLIITYLAIRDRVRDLIAKLKELKAGHSPEHFLQARKLLSTTEENIEIAAIMIYLNKTCYNGLYRVNRAGEFNVPSGRYQNPQILDEQNLLACSEALQKVVLKHGSFSEAKPQRGDFVYLDPPYDLTYSQYDGSGFGTDQHKELAEFCQRLDRQGVKFMLSNSDTELVRRLYTGFKIEEVHAPRHVSCKAEGRGKEQELIVSNY